MTTAEKVFAAIGVAFAISVLLRLLSFINLYFLRPSTLSTYAVLNAYALVTGASDGIGRGLAHELAARGLNVVLHGRNQSKLNKVKTDIEAAFPARKVRTVIADASKSASIHADVAAIAANLRDFLDGPLTVLINNCGGTQPLHREFLTLREMSPEEIDGVVDLNARFHVQLTRALLPLLFAEEGADAGAKGRPALVMYTGSAAGVYPAQWLTTYAPSKNFGQAFMVALGREMYETNPHVEALAIIVGKVTDTAFFKSKAGFFEPDSMTMAKAILDRVGCGRLSVVGYWTHAIQMFILTLMTEGLQTKAITFFMEADLQVGAGSKTKSI